MKLLLWLITKMENTRKIRLIFSDPDHRNSSVICLNWIGATAEKAERSNKTRMKLTEGAAQSECLSSGEKMTYATQVSFNNEVYPYIFGD